MGEFACITYNGLPQSTTQPPTFARAPPPDPCTKHTPALVSHCAVVVLTALFTTISSGGKPSASPRLPPSTPTPAPHGSSLIAAFHEGPGPQWGQALEFGGTGLTD